MLKEFIGEYKFATIDIHFNHKKYQASNIFIQNTTNKLAISNIKEILHFTVDQQLVDDIWCYRSNHEINYPTVDIIITYNSRRAFIKDATLVEWTNQHMAAIVDTIKFLTDDIYELATDPKIQNGFIKSKLINDSTFNRFYQILFEE